MQCPRNRSVILSNLYICLVLVHVSELVSMTRVTSWLERPHDISFGSSSQVIMFAKTNLNGVPCVWDRRSGCFVKPNRFGKPRSLKNPGPDSHISWYLMQVSMKNNMPRIHGWIFLHLQNASDKAEYFWGVDFHFKFLITVQPKILISKVHIQIKMRGMPESDQCCSQNDDVYQYLLAKTPPGKIAWNFDKILGFSWEMYVLFLWEFARSGWMQTSASFCGGNT